MSRLVSLIIPLFNERESLAELHTRIEKTIRHREERFEILFVDDGSTDGSSEEIRRLHMVDPSVGMIKHRINHGKSMALMQGFTAARGDFAITLDSDLQDEPENIPLFLKALEEGFDLVNGSRVDRKDSRVRKWLSRLFNQVVSRLLGLNVSDVNCGYKGYSKRLYKSLVLRGDLHRLIPAMAAMMGFRVVEIPISHAPRKFGSSKYKAFRHRGLLDVIALSASWATQFRPFHVFFELGIAFWVLAVLLFPIWFGMQCLLDQSAGLYSALTNVIFLILAWSCFTGTMLPITGLVLEQIMSGLQDQEWRGTLLDSIIVPEDGPTARLTVAEAAHNDSKEAGTRAE